MENMNMITAQLVVQITTNLDQFTFIKGNRPPNPQHIKKLSRSIAKRGMLCNPILVNEKLEIIDGQHRFLAAKEQNSAIYFIVVNGYGVEQVHALNVNQKNWTNKEFLEGYVAMGLKDYKVLQEFWHTYPWLKLNSCIAMLSNMATVESLTNRFNSSGNVSETKQVFKEGTWRVRDLNSARCAANWIKQIEPYFKEGYNSAGFVGTMLTIFKNKNYSHKEFLLKLSKRPRLLQKCATREQYKLLIEDIYNYRRRDKVNLRYN